MTDGQTDGRTDGPVDGRLLPAPRESLNDLRRRWPRPFCWRQLAITYVGQSIVGQAGRLVETKVAIFRSVVSLCRRRDAINGSRAYRTRTCISVLRSVA